MLSLFGLGKRPVRTSIPGGPGSVLIPPPYEPVPPGDYRYRETGALTAYRRYHSTMGGYNESNGAIAIGRPADFKDLAEFVRHARGALTTRWSVANESEGRWYGRPETFPELPGEGPNGPERTGKLSVHMVGMLKVYDAPGALYAVHDKRGVMIAIWIFNRDGGDKRARRLAERIAASWQP
jgi:hypothetical protein